MNRFSNSCLIIIVLLLGVIALRSLDTPKQALAASHIQYLVVNTGPAAASIQDELEKEAKDGWELVAPIYSAQVPGFTLVFRKEAR